VGDDGEFIIGKQKDGGVVSISAEYFDKHRCLSVVIQTSGTAQTLKADVAIPGPYLVEIPQWAKASGKSNSINQVYARIDDCGKAGCCDKK
jgi:hypothetical protein